MSVHDKVLTGVVEHFESGEDQYCEVLDDDFSMDAQETLMGMLHGMIGKRVIITVDEYPMPQSGVSPEHHRAASESAVSGWGLRRRRAGQRKAGYGL